MIEEPARRKYRFTTEDGTETLTVPEYHARPDLMGKIRLATDPPRGRRTLFCGLDIYSFDEKYLSDPANRQKRKDFDYLEEQVSLNPVAYYMPHEGVALDFLNDWDATIKVYYGPNGVGKSVLGYVDILLDLIPCDPAWPIFRDGGVRFREYRGPYTKDGFGVVSYEWKHHKGTLFPQVINVWTPKNHMEGKRPNFNSPSPMTEIAGTPLYYMACSQGQGAFESQALRTMMWDEQGVLNLFNAANERVRRRNGRHTFLLTPHHVEGRPDTGAGSWIHEMVLGTQTYGHIVHAYHASIEDPPDWVYLEKQKKAAIKSWITEPLENGDMKRYREGRSRVYGEFHEYSNLVFDEFEESIHVIDPFEIPESWTKYLAVDHGRVNPTAAVALAVSPEGDVVQFGEYYQKDRTASDNAQAIVRTFGNDVEIDTDFEYDSSDLRSVRYRQVCKKVRFYRGVMDSRSFARSLDDDKYSIGDIYKNNGLDFLGPANTGNVEFQIPAVKEYLKIDKDRTHIQTGKKGAPRFYVFRTCTWSIWEAKRYVNETKVNVDKWGNRNESEAPRKKDDHLMKCWIYGLQDNPVYIEGVCRIHESQEDEDEDMFHVEQVRDPYGGY